MLLLVAEKKKRLCILLVLGLIAACLPIGAKCDGRVLVVHSYYVVSYDQPATFSQWQTTIQRLDRNPKIDALMLPLYHTVRKDGTTRSMESVDVLKWTRAHTDKPLVGLRPRLIEDGGFLSVTVDPREHGRVAANMALDILSGKRASQIPIAVNKEGKVLINLKGTDHLLFNTSINIDQVADIVVR